MENHIIQEIKPQSSNPKGAGRLVFDGKDKELVLSKLQEVWGIGGSDGEAAFYADISTSALSRYLEKNPDIAEFRDKLKEKPVLKARQTIVRDLETVPTAQWYLERKKKDEFGQKEGVQIGVGIKLLVDI